MPSIGPNSGIVATPQSRPTPIGLAAEAVSPEKPIAQNPIPATQRPLPLQAGTAPVDVERVEMIKKAIESDNYPLVPAKISDAIIAAGMLLRAKK